MKKSVFLLSSAHGIEWYDIARAQSMATAPWYFFPFFLHLSLSAQIISGTITNVPETPTNAYTFGDGVHSVSLYWSVNNPDSSGWFYQGLDTAVAIATNVSSLSGIADASLYSFTVPYPGNYYVGPVFDAQSTGGMDSFLILRNTQNGFYAVVRIDDIFAYSPPLDEGNGYFSHAGLNATWWFQTDGSANFSAVPEPPTLAVALMGFGVLCGGRRWRL